MPTIDHPVFGTIGLEELTPPQLLSCWLQWSFLYYITHESVVDDSVYDKASQILLETYEEWQNHPHSHLVTKGDLTAGTLYTLNRASYPTIIVATSQDWVKWEWAETYRRFNGGEKS